MQPQTGNNTQSAITLVDLGLPALAPAAGQYTLSIASGMLVESDNGNSYHSLVGPQGPQGATGPTGPQGTTGATPERLDLKVRSGRLVRLERRGQQERQGRLDRKARSGRLARQERRARRERPGLQERLDRLVRRERQEPLGRKERRERRELLGQWVRKERRARQEQRERSDLRDPPECRVRLVHRGHQELQPLRPTTVSIMGQGTKRVWAQLKSGAHSIAIRSTCPMRRQSASWSRSGHRLCRAEAMLKPSTRQTERTGSHSREKYL